MKWWPFCKTYAVKCPDGREVIVYREPRDACPLSEFERTGERKTKVSSEGVGSLEHGSKISEIIKSELYKIDEANSDLMMKYRMAYITYSTNPCVNSDFLVRSTEMLMDEHTKLTKIRMHLLSEIELVKLQPENQEALQFILAGRYLDFDLSGHVGGVQGQIAASRAKMNELLKGSKHGS